MGKEKKFINDPKLISKEALAGYLSVSRGLLHAEGSEHVLVADEIPDGKVGILIGGGIAAEPLFLGYVGKNMADCAVIGNINAAPSPDFILKGTQAIDQGKGVLYLFNNYPGDVLCFDMAAELAEEEGIQTRTVIVCDDLGSAAEQKTDRRGIAGTVLLIKIAGGAASKQLDLESVYEVVKRAHDHMASLIVAAQSGSYLESGEIMFSLPDDEIEIGVGLHGEPGLGRCKMMPVNEIVDEVLNQLFADLNCKTGDEVAILVNSMGATSITELFIINNRITQYMNEKQVKIQQSDVGFYYNSQNMQGFSISILKLDDELKQYLDLPANSFSYKRWQP